jgi:hypothetical protein
VGYLEKVMLQDPSSRASTLHVYPWFIPNLISLDELGVFDAIFGVNYAESNKIIYARKDSQCFQSQLRQLSRALVGRDFNRPSNEEATHIWKNSDFEIKIDGPREENFGFSRCLILNGVQTCLNWWFWNGAW